MDTSKLANAQIGRAGELLVQYRLLLRGIESAPMTTDTGIDLVAYSARAKVPKTIQVKANLAPKPSGGKGRNALDWWFPEVLPAELLFLVDLGSERIWCFKAAEAIAEAQQKSTGRAHLYLYTDEDHVLAQGTKGKHTRDFDRYLLANAATALFEA